MNGYLVDTNVLSESTKPKPDTRVDAWFGSVPEDSVYISVLTVGELRRGITLLPQSARRIRLESWFQTLVEEAGERILPIDKAVAERWGILVAATEAVGRPLPALDSLMVATALVHDLTFVTRDDNRWEITGASLLNPWEL